VQLAGGPHAAEHAFAGCRTSHHLQENRAPMQTLGDAGCPVGLKT
jgi:hypothetical protein